jgi:hypothetical protein
MPFMSDTKLRNFFEKVKLGENRTWLAGALSRALYRLRLPLPNKISSAIENEDVEFVRACRERLTKQLKADELIFDRFHTTNLP